MGYPPQQPQDPYGQPYQSGQQDPYGQPYQSGQQDPYGQQYQSGPQYPSGPQYQSGSQYPSGPQYQSGSQYQQPYQSQPYSQPYMPVPTGPQYSPVQYTTVRERGFNPITAIVHACLWFFLHWWLALFTLGFWLIVAIPVTFFGWRVTRTIPVQHYQQPPYPPAY